MMPACWDSAENWAEWERLNRLASAPPGRPADYFCTDCLPAFKEAACRAGRCAYPDVTFAVVFERQRDTRTQRVYNAPTAALRGCRSEADEAAWRRRHQVRGEDGQA